MLDRCIRLDSVCCRAFYPFPFSPLLSSPAILRKRTIELIYATLNVIFVLFHIACVVCVWSLIDVGSQQTMCVAVEVALRPTSTASISQVREAVRGLLMGKSSVFTPGTTTTMTALLSTIEKIECK